MSDKKTVLLVDDEEEITTVLKDALAKDGVNAVVAHDGASGLALAFEKKPDLILLDILMPGADGWAFLEGLRKDPWGKNATVILLTNLSDTASASRAMEYGTYDFFVKTDWKIDEVIGRVKKRLGIEPVTAA